MGLVFFRGGNLVVKLNENPVEKVKSGVEMVVFEWRMSKSEGETADLIRGVVG